MRFSLYTEMQLHEGKSPQQLYARGARADRERRPARLRLLRVDRALLLPEVLDLGAPDGALRRRRAADEEHPLPDDAPRPAVPQPDGAGLGDRRDGHPHRRPLRVGRRPRPRLDSREGGRAARRARAAALRGGGRPALHRARERALLAQGRVLRGRRLARRPVPGRAVPGLPRRHLRPDVRARRRARLGRRRAAAPAVQGARGAARPLPGEVRRARQRARHRLDPRVPPRRGPRHRDARGARLGHEVHLREQLAAPRVREAGRRRARQGGLRLLRVRDHGAARRGAVRAARRGGLRLGRHAGRDRRADRGDPEDLPGISEIGITVNAGGAPHWMAIKNQELFASVGDPARPRGVAGRGRAGRVPSSASA